MGFDLGANNERASFDLLLFGAVTERSGWIVNAGPVLGYGSNDGPGARVGVSGWAAPIPLPTMLSVNMLALPHSQLLFLGTFSVRIGGGF